MNRINVLAFGGLGGNAFSAGLKTIILRLKGVPGVDFASYEDYTSWRRWGSTLISWRDPTVLIGHSFGVTAAFAAVRTLGDRGPQFPLMIAFDPSQWWWSNLSLMFSGGNTVPDRIASAVNNYQSSGLIGRQTLSRTDGSARGISNRLITGTIHSSIEDRADLQDDAVKRMKLLLT
jgi:hypothetical protein